MKDPSLPGLTVRSEGSLQAKAQRDMAEALQRLSTISELAEEELLAKGMAAAGQALRQQPKSELDSTPTGLEVEAIEEAQVVPSFASLSEEELSAYELCDEDLLLDE